VTARGTVHRLPRKTAHRRSARDVQLESDPGQRHAVHHRSDGLRRYGRSGVSHVRRLRRLVGAKLTLNGTSVSLNGGLSYVSGASGFFEAPFLIKRNSTYYVVYAAGSNPATIDYATASAPLGPYTRRGRILNSLPTNSTDAATSHPAVAEFAGQWYLVYHLSNGPNGGGTYHRMVAVDKLTFNSDGTIPLITPSSGLQF